MAEELDIDSVFKLKVEDLKTELSKRGLPKSGSKAELQERLLQFVTTQDENDVLSGLELETGGGASDLGGTVDDSVLNEAHLAVTPTEIAPPKDDLVLTEEEEEFVAKQEETNTDELLEKKVPPKPATISAIQSKDKINKVLSPSASEIEEETNTEELLKKKEPPKPATISAIQSKDKINKVLSPSASEIERKANRTKRSGQAVSEEERKKSRMEKFGGTTEKKSLTEDEKIKQREQKFATSTTTSETATLTITSTNNSTPTSKLQQRSERFADDKIKKRQERFGVVQATTINTDAKLHNQMSSDDSIKVLLACNVTPSDEIDRFEELLQKKCPQFEFKTLDSVAKVKGHKSFEKKMEKLIEHKDTKCVVVVCTPALTAFMDEKSKKNLTEIVADNEKACRSVFKDFFKTEAKEKQKLILVTLGDRCPVPQVLRDFPVIVQNENENAFENLVITQIMSKL